MTAITYLGLGTMGAGMVKNLVKAGFDVTVWNRTPDKAEALPGVGVAESIAAGVAGADIVMYSLADDAAVRSVVFGDGGVLASIQPGTIAVDMSTISAALSDEEAAAFAALGVEFLDAPVFGSKDETNAGGLWIVVGGPDDTFDKVEPAFEAMAETIHHMGGHGTGVRMKLVGNLMVAGELELLGEALTLAKKAGLDLNKVLGVAAVTDFKTPIFNGVGQRVLTNDYSPAFSLKLMRKDAGLIGDLAASVDAPVPSAELVKEHLDRAFAEGLGDEHASAFIKLIAADAGTDLVE